jgi:hypothetical protein
VKKYKGKIYGWCLSQAGAFSVVNVVGVDIFCNAARVGTALRFFRSATILVVIFAAVYQNVRSVVAMLADGIGTKVF